MNELIQAKKSLGQHWLKDEDALRGIVAAAKLTKSDTVLEIGPGLGSLTELLVKEVRKVVAVETDEPLARGLSARFVTNNLIVKHQDILNFDLGELPRIYKVVSNTPYYITGKILRLFTETSYLPSKMVLLLQKEVAERLVVKPGDLNIVAVAVQLEYEPRLGQIIPSRMFDPPPKVDSQVIIFDKRQKPLFKGLDKNVYMRIVRAGFVGKRKKLRSSLSAGLAFSKQEADKLLREANISGDLRAQNLSLEDWYKLYSMYKKGLV